MSMMQSTVFSTALWLGTGLLVIGGLGYRQLASELASRQSSIPLASNALESLPLEFDSWHGKEEPLPADVAKGTDADLNLYRVYIGKGAAPISLFVGYGGRLREIAPHRPEVCFPGAGWTVNKSVFVELTLADGGSLPCRVYHFHRGGLRHEHVTVLNYYIVNGDFIADFEGLRERIQKSQDEKSYWARVQLASQDLFSSGEAAIQLRLFATASAEAIRRHLEEATRGGFTEPRE